MAELPGQLSQCGSELTSISPEREGAAEPIRHSPQPRGIFLSPSLFLPSFSRGSCFNSLFISTKPFFFFLALFHSPFLLLCFLQRQVSRRRVSFLTNQRHSLVASSPLVLHLYPPLLQSCLIPFSLLRPFFFFFILLSVCHSLLLLRNLDFLRITSSYRGAG